MEFVIPSRAMLTDVAIERVTQPTADVRTLVGSLDATLARLYAAE